LKKRRRAKVDGLIILQLALRLRAKKTGRDVFTKILSKSDQHFKMTLRVLAASLQRVMFEENPFKWQIFWSV